MNATDLANAIVRQAGRFIGLREVRPNADWDNPRTPGRDLALAEELRTMMRPSPWEEGWAYCAAFCEGVVTVALKTLGATPAQLQVWANVMTPHCVTSAHNFSERNLLVASPRPGAVWLARHGTSSNGHAGIVTTLDHDAMATIEANTSLDPTTPDKDREGDWITTRLCSLKGRGSLVTMGFINPGSILQLIGL